MQPLVCRSTSIVAAAAVDTNLLLNKMFAHSILVFVLWRGTRDEHSGQRNAANVRRTDDGGGGGGGDGSGNSNKNVPCDQIINFALAVRLLSASYVFASSCVSFLFQLLLLFNVLGAHVFAVVVNEKRNVERARTARLYASGLFAVSFVVVVFSYIYLIVVLKCFEAARFFLFFFLIRLNKCCFHLKMYIIIIIDCR